uniref:PDZ domain-containing protein n=1 Tax=Amphiprion percula TaxID=161767 RepID=A0A3P8SS75_AMPPE
ISAISTLLCFSLSSHYNIQIIECLQRNTTFSHRYLEMNDIVRHTGQIGPSGELAVAQETISNALLPLPQIDITPGPDGRFGFTIVGDSPLMVEDCMPSGPAGRNGLKAGDYVMEVNGIPVKHHETAAAMIKAAQGRPLRLGVLSMARRPKRLSSSMRSAAREQKHLNCPVKSIF